MGQKYYIFKYYSFFKSGIVVFFRIIIFLILTSLIIAAVYYHKNLKLPFEFFSLFFINEIFLNFKVFYSKPTLLVSQSKDGSLEAIWFSTRLLLEKSKSLYDFILKVIGNQEIKFILEKIDRKFVLQEDAEITEPLLLGKAFEIGNKVGADYVREVDLFSAYLLLGKNKDSIIKNVELNEEDIINILVWVRNKFSLGRITYKKPTFTGEGIFDSLTYSWSVEANKYAENLTKKVLSYKFPPSVVGRKTEYEQIVSILSKDISNNIILIGNAGLGKTSLVEYFSYQSYLRNVPAKLINKKVFEIFPDRILAGIKSQGELSERIENLFLDLASSPEVIIFIQNIDVIFGSLSSGLDILDAIFPYLKQGKFQVIGTTTLSSYKRQLESKTEISSLFETIFLHEPDKEKALFMIFDKIPEKEQVYDVSFTYKAIQSAIDLSSSYLVDSYLPGKAINLLDEVASQAKLTNKKIIEKEDVVRKIEGKSKVIISEPTEKEKDILLNLEEAMHKRIIDQEDAVVSLSDAIRRLRSGFINTKRPIGVFLFLGPTGVGKSETAKALADIYFGGLTVGGNTSEDIEKEKEEIYGNNKKEEIISQRMIRLDMSEYQSDGAIRRLLGSLPGEQYSPSEFIELVKENPFSLILLDEFEKADKSILDVFLQVFEDGRLTDNMGRTISFTSSIIIATSNAGSEFIREVGEDKDIKNKLINFLQEKGIFKPELLNRFDDVIIFKHLARTEARSVADLILGNVFSELSKQGFFINYTEAVLDRIVRESFSLDFGARNIRRYIENTIETYVSKLILENKVQKGFKMTLNLDQNGNFLLQKR